MTLRSIVYQVARESCWRFRIESLHQGRWRWEIVGRRLDYDQAVASAAKAEEEVGPWRAQHKRMSSSLLTRYQERVSEAKR